MNIQEINQYLLKFQKIPEKEKIFFIQHLRVMIRSGMSLSRALNTLSKQTKNKRFQEILFDIRDNIEKGNSFAESLKKHSKIFGELFVNMINAGEISGKLEGTLNELFLQMKKDYEIKGKVKGAMIYPAVVLFAMVSIGIGMMVFVVPKLAGIFLQAGAELPLPTKILIATSDFLIHKSIFLILGLIFLVFGIKFFLKNENNKYYFHFFLLRIPILGKIIQKINLARLLRTLSSLLKTDIPIAKTLKISSKVLGNIPFRRSVNQAAEKVVKGISIADTLKNQNKLFPPVVTEMISVGEETGSLDDVLAEMASFYEEDVDQTMKNLPSIIEPVLILVLGVGVALMAIAIIMPMYKLTSNI